MAKRMIKQHINILRTKMSSLEFKLKEIDEARNYLLDEIKLNVLMSENRKKT